MAVRRLGFYLEALAEADHLLLALLRRVAVLVAASDQPVVALEVEF